MPTRARRKRTTSNRVKSRKETHSEDGVDLTLIRWMLSLTPAERLDVLQQHVRSILRLRGEKADT
jgi:hypothetical protein